MKRLTKTNEMDLQSTCPVHMAGLNQTVTKANQLSHLRRDNNDKHFFYGDIMRHAKPTLISRL
jgi:hypothetical protein